MATMLGMEADAVLQAPEPPAEGAEPCAHLSRSGSDERGGNQAAGAARRRRSSSSSSSGRTGAELAAELSREESGQPSTAQGQQHMRTKTSAHVIEHDVAQQQAGPRPAHRGLQTAKSTLNVMFHADESLQRQANSLAQPAQQQQQPFMGLQTAKSNLNTVFRGSQSLRRQSTSDPAGRQMLHTAKSDLNLMLDEELASQASLSSQQAGRHMLRTAKSNLNALLEEGLTRQSSHLPHRHLLSPAKSNLNALLDQALSHEGSSREASLRRGPSGSVPLLTLSSSAGQHVFDLELDMLSRPRQPDYSPAAQKLLSQYRQLAAGMDLFAPIFLPEEPARRRRKPAVKAPQRKPKLESASSTAFQLAKAHAEVIMRRQVLSSATLPENISASERMRQMPAAPRKAPQTRSADQLPKQLLEVALQAAAAIKEGERLFRQGVAADDNYVIHGNQRADEDVPESQLQHGVTLSSEAVRDQLRTLQTVAVDDGSAAWRNRMKPREASTSSGESDSDVSASGSSDESHHRHSRNKSPALYDILGRGAARKKKKKAAGTTGEAGQALTIPAGSSETTGEEAHADEAIEADTEAEFSLDMPQTPENTSSTAAGAPGEANTQPAEQLQDLAPGAAADTESIAPPQPAADENDEANGKRSRIRWNDEPSTGDEADAPLADVARVHVSDTVLRDADKNIITIARDASGTQLKLIWDPLGQKVVKIILDDGLEIPLFNTLPSGEAQRGTRGSILQVLETPEGHSIIRSEVQQRGGPQSKGQTQHFRSVMTKQCDLVCVLREDDGQVLFGYDIYAPDAARKPTGESGATKGRAARKSSSKKLSKAGRSASSRKLLLARRKSPAGSAGKPQEGEDDEASSSAEEDGVAEAAMDARYLKRIDTFCKTIKRSSHCESVGDSGGEVEVVDLLVDADKLVPAIEGGEFQAAFMRMSNACIPMDSIAARMVSTPSPFRPDSVMSLLSQHGSDSEPKTGGLPDGGPEESEVEADAPHEESSTSELGDEDSLTQQQIPDPAVDQETAPDAAVEPTTPPSQSSETATITPGSPFEQPDSSLTAPATPKTVEQLPQPGNKPARLPPADASSLPAAHHGSAHPRPKPAKHSPPELATAKRADSRAAGPGPLSPGPLTKEHPQTIAPPWRAAGAANGFHPAAADRFFHPSEPLASPSSGIAQIGPAWRDPGIGARNFGRVHHDLGPAITHAEGHGVYGPWRPPGAGDHLPDDFVYVPAGGLVEEEPPLHEPDGQRIWRYPPPPDAFEAAPVMDWRSQIEEQEKALRKAFTADPLRVYQRYEEWLQHRAEMLHKAGQKPGLEVKSFDYAHSSLEGSPQSSPLDTSPRYGFRPNGLKRVPIARPADKPLSRATPDLKLPALVNNADGKAASLPAPSPSSPGMQPSQRCATHTVHHRHSPQSAPAWQIKADAQRSLQVPDQSTADAFGFAGLVGHAHGASPKVAPNSERPTGRAFPAIR